MSGLGSEAKLEVQDMIKECQETCPKGTANKNEIEHLKKSVEGMEEVDNTIFEKIDKQNTALSTGLTELNKFLSDKIDKLMLLLIAQLSAAVVGIVVAVVAFFITVAQKRIIGG